MSNHIHSFKFTSEDDGKIKRIYVDGVEITGIHEAFIHLTIDDLPRVWMATDVCTADVEIDFPEAKVVLKKGKDGNGIA